MSTRFGRCDLPHPEARFRSGVEPLGNSGEESPDAPLSQPVEQQAVDLSTKGPQWRVVAPIKRTEVIPVPMGVNSRSASIAGKSPRAPDACQCMR